MDSMSLVLVFAMLLPSIAKRLLHQFAQCRTVDDVLRPAGRISDGSCFRIDAEVAIKRGNNFAERHRAIAGVFAEAIRGADYLPRFHAASRHQSAADLRPMIAAGILVDARRPPELAPGDDRHVIEHSTSFQVVD